jgi:CheY-like chemotaxis protein
MGPTRVVLVTGSAEPEDAAQAREIGVSAVLGKDMPLEEVVARIVRLARAAEASGRG